MFSATTHRRVPWVICLPLSGGRLIFDQAGALLLQSLVLRFFNLLPEIKVLLDHLARQLVAAAPAILVREPINAGEHGFGQPDVHLLEVIFGHKNGSTGGSILTKITALSSLKYIPE